MSSNANCLINKPNGVGVSGIALNLCKPINELFN